jgi:FKBP-type peptidyl-prolyl cis-trans isomerase
MHARRTLSAPGANTERTAMSSELKTVEEKTSYALGLDVGMSFRRLPIELDMPSFFAGIEDMLKGSRPRLTQEEFAETMKAFQASLQAKAAEAQAGAGEENMKAGAAFLAKNSMKKGVVTTDSGLQYTVLAEGSGAMPKRSDVVTVHYTGTLIDGSVFDSSVERGEPASFPVGGVIPGWTEGLQLMKVGGKYKLFVPAELAYGERGAGDVIGPNATLIFEVELLGIGK